MNDSNNNTTLIVVDCDEGKMGIRADDASLTTKTADKTNCSDVSLENDVHSEEHNEWPQSEYVEI